MTLEPARLEQAAKDRDFTEARRLADRIGGVVIEQASDHEGLTRTQFDGGFGRPALERGHGRVHREVEARHRRAYAQRDAAIGQHGRREGQLHAILLELDAVALRAVADRVGIFAARQEAGRLT